MGSQGKSHSIYYKKTTDLFSDEHKLSSGAFGKVYLVRLLKKKVMVRLAGWEKSDPIVNDTEAAHYMVRGLFTYSNPYP